MLAYIPRSLERIPKKVISELPAVALTRPRRSGKATLLQHLYGRRFRYVSLELPDVGASAADDLRDFLDTGLKTTLFRIIKVKFFIFLSP